MTNSPSPVHTYPTINCHHLCSSIGVTLQYLSIRITKCFQQIGKELAAPLTNRYISGPFIFISSCFLGYLIAINLLDIFITKKKLISENEHYLKAWDERISLQSVGYHSIFSRAQIRKKQIEKIIFKIEELTIAITTRYIHCDSLPKKAPGKNPIGAPKNQCHKLASAIEALLLQIKPREDLTEIKEDKQRENPIRMEAIEAEEQPQSEVTTSRKIDPRLENIIEQVNTILIDVLEMRVMLAGDHSEVPEKIAEITKQQLRTKYLCFLEKAGDLFA